MSVYVVTPKLESPKNRSDGKGAFVVSASSEANALARAEAMAGEVAGTFNTNDWRAVLLSDTPGQDFVCESRPIGLRDGSTWKGLDRGGDYLAI